MKKTNKKKLVKKTNKKSAKKTVKKVNKVNKTYVVLVVDESSSMSSLKDSTISAFNEQLNSLKTVGSEIKKNVIFVTFNSDVEWPVFDKPLEELNELNDDSYCPNGMTAMYDAIGLTVNKMHKELKDVRNENVSVLFTVLTDGFENASRSCKKEDISSLVTELTKTGRWTFSVLGANIDLNKMSDELKIAKSNMIRYKASSLGVARGLTASSAGYAKYFDTMETSGIITSNNLYSSNNDEVLDTTSEDFDLDKAIKSVETKK